MTAKSADARNSADAPEEEQVVSRHAKPGSEPESPSAAELRAQAERDAAAATRGSLMKLGFVNFDSSAPDNTSTGAMVAAEWRKHFRRDVYVGIDDREQGIKFLGRIVEGPFHAPHEVGTDSAITRTTVLHPERTQFRPTYYVYGTIEVLGVLGDDDRVTPTPTRPRPYSEIYVLPAEQLRRLLGIEGDFLLGTLMGYSNVMVHADSTKKGFLPRNVGIFGTVGSGKSNTTQVLMEEAVKAGWAVVAVDVEGEYVQMDMPTQEAALRSLLVQEYQSQPKGVPDLKVYVPAFGHSEAPRPQKFKVPISAIEPELIGDILDFTEPQVRLFGRLVDLASRSAGQKSGGRTGVLQKSLVAEQPQRSYTLQTLIEYLTENEDGKFKIPNIQRTEEITAHTLRSKLIHLGRSGVLDWNQTNSIPELPIDELLVPERLSVLDVSESDDRSRNIAIAYMLSALFLRVIDTERGQQMPNGKTRPPLLVVIEEVHTFVSKESAARMRAVLDKLQVISRRGRKRWMALALVSQQPGHVPDELFELANTRFIHQLKSVANLAPVKQTTGGVHEALWSTVPALGPGQCLISGAVFKNPIFVNMRPAQSCRLLTG
jgi:DNA helicase HerA-like ATPase